MSDEVSFKSGDVIFKERQPGDVAYLLLAGKVDIIRGEGVGRAKLGTIVPGGVFGEMALIDPAPRLASAVAVEPTRCRRITRNALERALDQSPPLARYLLQSFVRNIRNATGGRLDVVNLTPDPASTIRSERQKMRVLDRKAFATGEIIFRQNSEGQVAYLIQTGEVDLIRESEDGRSTSLRRMGPGEVFGEMALIDMAPRYATAVAMHGLNVEVIRADHFNQLMAEAPPIVRALMRIYVGMIRSQPGSAS